LNRGFRLEMRTYLKLLCRIWCRELQMACF